MTSSAIRQTLRPGDAKDAWRTVLDRARKEGWLARLWAKDGSLWPGGAAGGWLGWIDAARGKAVDIAALAALSAEVRDRAVSDVLLIGMGGSSLGPEMIARTFGARPGFPRLCVLDSTHPAQAARILERLDLTRTLVVIASKSGSTLEPDVLYRHVFDRAAAIEGPARAAQRFIAITDPGSKLEAEAKAKGFWRLFHGEPEIGGRFSLLSVFGLVPAALIGLDIAAILETLNGAPDSDLSVSALELGALMGVAAAAGRDKLTLSVDPAISDLAGWLEQLVAESTGKHGQGIIPVVGEASRPGAEAHGPGAERMFVHIGLVGGGAAPLPSHEVLAPGVEIRLPGPEALWAEALRWEIAVALAGVVLGIDPFDQPDVEAAKVKTRELADAFTASGVLPRPAPAARTAGLALFPGTPASGDAETLLRRHLNGVTAPRGYIALLAYLDQSDVNLARMNALRASLAARLGAPVLVQFGPRYLHSTGQAFKGGPGGGVFILLTDQTGAPLAIPGQAMDFRTLVDAQALGDAAAMTERGRPVLRIDLGGDLEGGFTALEALVARALEHVALGWNQPGASQRAQGL
ncbi:MAG: hypothetical protein KGL69_03780 [Alphaproteobacteria bacterium]|nr:hypothetical protein [Alphaproteobacteria bacterium]